MNSNIDSGQNQTVKLPGTEQKPMPPCGGAEPSTSRLWRWQWAWVPTVLLGAAYLLYANSFSLPWIYDDFPVIVNNPDVRSLQGFWDNSYPGRPLRELTYLLDGMLFGLEDPLGWHIQNIFWHGICGWLIFVLTRRLGMSRTGSWVAALLFLAHPVQVEVVANISHRKDSLALAFSLLAILAYSHQGCLPRGRRGLWSLGACLLAVIACFAKLNALVLPVVFLCYHWAVQPLDAERRRRVIRFCLLGMTGLAAIIAGWWLLANGAAQYQQAIRPLMIKMNYLREAAFVDYWWLALKSWGVMFLNLVAPLQLAPEYTYPVPQGWADPWVVVVLLALVTYLLVLVWAFFRLGRLFFALAWMGLFWLPVSNLWPLSYFAADRYLYAPSVGFFILVALGLERLLSARPLFLKVTVAGLVLVLSVLTWQQTRLWSSPLALWSQAVKVSPESTWALHNLGTAYMLKGELQKALPLLQRAARNFNDSKPLYTLGQVYERLGDQRAALRYYLSFLSMNDPRYRTDALLLRRHLQKHYRGQVR